MSKTKKTNATKKTTTSKAKKPAAAKTAKASRLSAPDAAAQILAGKRGSMNCRDLIAEMAKRNLWKSPGGKTPDATLYAAIIREIATKGKTARFKKTGPGEFAAQKTAA